MSCYCPTPKCDYNYGGIVAVGIPTVRGNYIVMKPPSFYTIQFKKKMYDEGFSRIEIEQTIREYLCFAR